MDASPHRDPLSFLAEIPDPRSRHGRQHSLLRCAGPGLLRRSCAAHGYAAIAQWAVDHDIAFMHRLGFTRTPPKLGGIRKVLIALNRTAFENALTQWAETVWGRPLQGNEAPPQACALDGKTACGSFDGLNKAVHLLSLVAHESGLTVAQTEVPHGGVDKTNEHKTALRLLKGLVLEGRLIKGGGPIPATLERQSGWFIDTRSARRPWPEPPRGGGPGRIGSVHRSDPLVGQGLLVGLGMRRLDRLELAARLRVGQADLLGVPVDHPAGELLELGPAVEILEQPDLVPLLLILGPGEEGLAGPGWVRRLPRPLRGGRERAGPSARGAGGCRASAGSRRRSWAARRPGSAPGRTSGRRRGRGSGPRRT